MAALIEIPSSIVGERKIEVQGITKEYVNGRERMLALQPIDLEVRRGEFLCIVGPSGCGKSTLLHIIAGLDQPSGGSILIDGQPTKRSRTRSHFDLPGARPFPLAECSRKR